MPMPITRAMRQYLMEKGNRLGMEPKANKVPKTDFNPLHGDGNELRRSEFYKKVQNVPIQDEYYLQLYEHCIFFFNFFFILK